MPVNILMPALSPTMTEGTLAKWLKKEGDAIASGDVIAEIETDKATMEVEAVDEGVLGRILVSAGSQGVKVNEVIAVLLEEGEDAAALEKAVKAPGSPAPVAAASAAPAPVSSPAASGGIVTTAANTGNRIFITPLARRIAEQKGLSPAAIRGTGPGGRITRDDVEKATQGGTATRAAASPAQDTAAIIPAGDAPLVIDQNGMPPFRSEAHTTMRKVIARRLTESKQTVPHFYLSLDVELDDLLALRTRLNSREGAVKLSVNDFIIRACGLALHDVPAANASWTEEGVRYYDRADISVAVAIDGGLITPIIRGAGQKRLPAISQEMKDLAARARAGKLKPEEFTGGTFSLSNLGMFGIRHFGAIINPPQACILAVGAGEERALVKDGVVVVRNVMTVTLSVDHRVVDGAVGAEYLAAFRKRVEDPLGLLL